MTWRHHKVIKMRSHKTHIIHGPILLKISGLLDNVPHKQYSKFDANSITGTPSINSVILFPHTKPLAARVFSTWAWWRWQSSLVQLGSSIPPYLHCPCTIKTSSDHVLTTGLGCHCLGLRRSSGGSPLGGCLFNQWITLPSLLAHTAHGTHGQQSTKERGSSAAFAIHAGLKNGKRVQCQNGHCYCNVNQAKEKSMGTFVQQHAVAWILEWNLRYSDCQRQNLHWCSKRIGIFRTE